MIPSTAPMIIAEAGWAEVETGGVRVKAVNERVEAGEGETVGVEVEVGATVEISAGDPAVGPASLSINNFSPGKIMSLDRSFNRLISSILTSYETAICHRV